MKKKNESTFDRIMADPKRKAAFDEGYEEFLISEFLIEAMNEEKASVRSLSKKTGVSPAMIQNLRSGKSTNVSLKKLLPILGALHYRIKFEKI
ncbi:MAG: helix-turn-helix domain-containing protein [Spirochaetota bacterium]